MKKRGTGIPLWKGSGLAGRKAERKEGLPAERERESTRPGRTAERKKRRFADAKGSPRDENRLSHGKEEPLENYTVKPEEAGRRLREILRGPMSISYSAMKSAKWNGRILLNGEPAFVDVRVKDGDRVEAVFPEKRPAYQTVPFYLALKIPYEDDALLIVDKPAPLASQSSAGHPEDSLENAVFAHLGCEENFIYRPVNRLDRGTSGLMVIAKTPHAQDLLQRQLHTPDFRREYLALTEGVPDPPEGTIDAPIAKENAASVRREVRPDGKPARTDYRVIRAEGGRALVRLRLETGRTHQIRVHLRSIGCPVCGDFLYGRELPEEFPGRFALHSAFLSLRHPLTGERLRFESLPDWVPREWLPAFSLHFR